MIENATSGSQIITIKQGSGATVNVPNGSKVMVVTDGAGAGAAVFNANPTEIGGTVTSVGGTGTVQGLTLSGTVTSSGNLTLGGSLADVDLTSLPVTGKLPLANGGTGASLRALLPLTPRRTVYFFWDDSTGATRFLTVGSGLQISDTTLSSTDAGGTVTSVAISGGTTGLTTSGGPITSSGTVTIAGTLAVANGGTNATTAAGARTSLGAAAYPIQKGANYTAVSGDVIVVTAGSITITLPATPSAGDTVGIKDGTGTASATSFTVARNGSNIASSATDLTFDVDFGEITMSYIDGTIGWSV
jgi:hypothetical protein